MQRIKNNQNKPTNTIKVKDNTKLKAIIENTKEVEEKVDKLLLDNGSYKNIYTKYKISELYEKYDFLRTHEYDGFKLFLREAFRGSDEEIEFIGEGVNAFVIEHPKDITKVIKVGKALKDDISIEFKTHNNIYSALEKLKQEPWLDIKNVKIPRITYMMGDTFFQMERIFGQTFKTKFYIETYKRIFKNLGVRNEEFTYLRDNQVEEILKMEKVEMLPRPDTTDSNELEHTYNEWWEQKYENAKEGILQKAKTMINTIGIGMDSETDIYTR